MARQRMVRPEFFDSESLALCSIPARLLFIGLWVMGDDYGNQRCQMVRLKHRVFPYDDMPDSEFEGMLAELEDVGCIKLYEVGGERFLNVPNFAVYQTVRKPSKSLVPEPPKSVQKARRTSMIQQWRTGDAPVAHQCGSDALVTHQYGTGDAKERRKEGSNFSLREKIANERAREAAAVEGSTAPRAVECPDCGTPARTDGMEGGKPLFWCPECSRGVVA